MNFYKTFFLTCLSLLALSLSSQEVDFTESEVQAIINQINQDSSPLVIENGDISTDNSKLECEGSECESLESTASINISSNIFGYDFVQTSPTSISATTDLPVPNDYRIALKDEIRIILSGAKRSGFTLKVGLDGTILFPEIGSIQVLGETFSNLKDKIKNIIENSYVGTSVDISITSLNAKKINILGAVRTPGTYLVNPFTTLSNALAYSGGLSAYASLRSITLIRGDKIIEYDLYKLLLNGDRTNDINIEAGDTILVKTTNNFVEIIGEVKRPMIYEYLKNEKLNDIVNFANGFKYDANEEKISLTKFTEETASIETFTTDLSFNQDLLDIKVIEVFPKNKSVNLDIFVSGPIENPGYFEYEKYPNLKDVIDGVTFTNQIYRYAGMVELGPTDSKIFSLTDISTQDIELKPNSKVIFFKLEDVLNETAIESLSFNHSRKLFEQYNLFIEGDLYAQTFEYLIPVYGKYKVTDLVEFLGIDLDGSVLEKTVFFSPLEDLIIEDDYRNFELFSKKFSRISFKSRATELISVTIDGEVLYPGTYRVKQNSTVMDLYEQAGFLKDSADKNVAVFTRNSVREIQLNSLKTSQDQLKEFLLVNTQRGINTLGTGFDSLLRVSINPKNLGRISGDFSMGAQNLNSFVLQDGDSLFVPKKVATVSIFGEVLNPKTILYQEGKKLTDYIKLAGGYKQYALRSNVYVIDANGFVKVRPKFLFINGNLKIRPGDTIIIPRDLRVNEVFGIDSILPISGILSNLAFASAALETLKNN